MKAGTLFLIFVLNMLFERSLACSVMGTSVLCSNISAIDNVPNLKHDQIGRIRHLKIVKSNIPILSRAIFSEFQNLTKLEITESYVKIVTPGAFDGLDRLTDLRFVDNQLTTNLLNKGMFSSLDKLEKLILNRQQLHYVQKSMFVGLKNLRSLYIERSNLTEIEDDAFETLEHLEILDVTGNPLVKFNVALPKRLLKLDLSFCGLNNFDFTITSLTMVWLIGNKLTVLEKPIFEKSKFNIQSLSLQENQISTINRNYFRGLGKMSYLYLHRNKIKKIDVNLFHDLRNLKILNLSSNLIEELSLGTFDALIELTHLDVSNNKLAYLNPSSLASSTKLKTLSLENNLISSFASEKLLNRLKNLESVGLNHNRWTCAEATLIHVTFKNYKVVLSNANSYNSLNVGGIACTINTSSTDTEDVGMSVSSCNETFRTSRRFNFENNSNENDNRTNELGIILDEYKKFVLYGSYGVGLLLILDFVICVLLCGILFKLNSRVSV